MFEPIIKKEEEEIYNLTNNYNSQQQYTNLLKQDNYITKIENCEYIKDYQISKFIKLNNSKGKQSNIDIKTEIQNQLKSDITTYLSKQNSDQMSFYDQEYLWNNELNYEQRTQDNEQTISKFEKLEFINSLNCRDPYEDDIFFQKDGCQKMEDQYLGSYDHLGSIDPAQNYGANGQAFSLNASSYNNSNQHFDSNNDNLQQLSNEEENNNTYQSINQLQFYQNNQIGNYQNDLNSFGQQQQQNKEQQQNFQLEQQIEKQPQQQQNNQQQQAYLIYGCVGYINDFKNENEMMIKAQQQLSQQNYNDYQNNKTIYNPCKYNSYQNNQQENNNDFNLSNNKQNQQQPLYFQDPSSRNKRVYDKVIQKQKEKYSQQEQYFEVSYNNSEMLSTNFTSYNSKYIPNHLTDKLQNQNEALSCYSKSIEEENEFGIRNSNQYIELQNKNIKYQKRQIELCNIQIQLPKTNEEEMKKFSEELDKDRSSPRPSLQYTQQKNQDKQFFFQSKNVIKGVLSKFGPVYGSYLNKMQNPENQSKCDERNKGFQNQKLVEKITKSINTFDLETLFRTYTQFEKEEIQQICEERIVTKGIKKLHIKEERSELKRKFEQAINFIEILGYNIKNYSLDKNSLLQQLDGQTIYELNKNIEVINQASQINRLALQKYLNLIYTRESYSNYKIKDKESYSYFSLLLLQDKLMDSQKLQFVK